MGNADEFKAKYSARELAREWGWSDHKRVIRVLASVGIRQHVGANGKGKWFWTTDIKSRSRQLYEWWKEKRHDAAMAKTARGAA